METLKLREILEATGGELISGDPGAEIKSISTDSRTLKKGDLFIALKGKHFDGHDFLKEAREKGARGLLVENNAELERRNSGFVAVGVKDTLESVSALGLSR